MQWPLFQFRMRNMRYGSNLPFCSWVTALTTCGQKHTLKKVQAASFGEIFLFPYRFVKTHARLWNSKLTATTVYNCIAIYTVAQKHHILNALRKAAKTGRSYLWARFVMDISSPRAPVFWCSQLRGKLDDSCINRWAPEHISTSWNSPRIHFTLINSCECCAFKSAYLF